MNKKEKTHMSFWGVGPIFGAFNIIFFGTELVLTFIYPEFFRFETFPILFYILGGLFTAFGLYLWITAGVQVDKCILKGVLATRGVYGIVRNPIYSGILFFISGVCFSLRSWLLICTIPLSYLILKLLLQKEDKVLTETFGGEYIQYRNKVNSVLPKWNTFYKAFFYPVETQEITNTLFAVKNRDVNLFIYKTENQYICFDTGYGNKEILTGLSKLGINPEDITTVFLTHSDPDHSKGIHLFPKAKLYFGKNEEPLINGQKGRIGIFYRNPEITRDYILLENNQTITINSTKVTAVYTPGHTTGHVMYQINNEIIISGDAVIWQNGFIKPFYRFFNMNNRQAVKSAKRITELEGKYLICTAHTGLIYT